MSIKIALAGNPNCGKTTLFNALTGSNQFVGNWPGVTVEKKEGKLKKHKGIIITDLPGIYSLSPYTLEEVVARNYLINERPDAILNIIDGTNLERNLYLTTQLTELGIPVVIAINMVDIVRKNGDKIDINELSKRLGCRVVEISALKGEGVDEAAQAAVEAAKGEKTIPRHSFCGTVERALAHIEGITVHQLPKEQKRWYAIKLFERDDKVLEQLKLEPEISERIEKEIKSAECELDDDAQSIITNERYIYITSIVESCCKKKNIGKLSVSDKIDRVVTNRFAALPVFAIIMFIVYYVSVSTVGTFATDWANDGVFGEGWHLFGIGAAEYEQAASLGEADPSDYGFWVSGVPVVIENGLDAIGCADWLKGLILDGIVGGVGAVLGFVPQMLVLFMFLAFLEGCGYMARVAFVLDRVFRKFGLSGKSFIPMLIGTGCGVPGIMASRTIENERDRRMTIITTTFMPCGAKLPIIALVAGAMFGGAWWVAPSAYFVGIAAIIVSGVILKKTRLFSGEPAPFVMELPAYHMPTAVNILRSMWERAWSFIKKAGTIILLSSVILWFLQAFGFENGSFGMVENVGNSILAVIGSAIAWIFAPLGWGNWQGAVATITGLIAKENVVSTFGVLFGGFEEVAEDGWQIWANMRAEFTALSAYSFLIFNLLCAPCFAAIGAIRREMNSAKWTLFAIGYQCVFAYVISLIVYQIGSVFMDRINYFGLSAAVILLAIIVFFCARQNTEKRRNKFAQLNTK